MNKGRLMIAKKAENYYLCKVKRMSDKTARVLACVLIAATALLAAGVASWRLLQPREPHVDIDYDLYPVRGIDISAHNGTPDFDSIAAAGIKFVYLKASEGVTFRDPSFMRNYLAAKRAGLVVGAYHFFRFDCDGTLQAANFLAAIVGCELQLPPAVDVEEWGNPAGYATTTINERLRSMTALVEVRRGPCMLYTNKNGAARFMPPSHEATSDDGEAELWICSFTDPPIRRQWRIWQHSHCGRIAGVKGKVDLNIFNGSADEWHQWLAACALRRKLFDRERDEAPAQ